MLVACRVLRFRVDLALPAFRTTTLTLHPDQPGEYPFACGMNMLHGTLRILPGKHASVGAAAGSAVGSVGASMSDSGDSDIRATADGAHASGSAETGVQCAQKGAVQTSGSGDSGKSRGSESEIRASSPVLSWRPSARFPCSAPPCSCCIRCRTGCNSC